MGLDVKIYDPVTDTIEIEGTAYSGCLFRELGCNIPSTAGQILRVGKKEGGVVTVIRLKKPSDYETGMGTSEMMWEMLSEIVEGEKLPESLNKAIYALRDNKAFIIEKE